MGFDIKDRSMNFALRVVDLVKKIPGDTAGRELAKQLFRSGTSVGANLEEADGASTRNDFFYKVSIARKEAKESRYWLEIVIRANVFYDSLKAGEAESLRGEALELSRILSAILKKK